MNIGPFKELSACLEWLSHTSLPLDKTSQARLCQNIRFASLCHHRYELIAKISWLAVYALGIKWIPNWFEKLNYNQYIWLTLACSLYCVASEWSHWYADVAKLLENINTSANPDKYLFQIPSYL